MAARLPDTLAVRAPQGRRPQQDPGLGELAQGLNAAIEGAGVMFARKADAEAADAMVQFQTDFQTRAAERAAAYDGSAPGFAAAEAETFDRELKAFEQTSVRRSARGAFRQRGDEAKAGYVGRVVAIEGQARAGVVAERREAADRGDLSKAELLFQAEVAKATKPLYDDGDVNDPAFVDNIMAARLASAAKVRETLPERLKPRWDTAMAAGAAKEQAAALAFREGRQEQRLASNARDIFQLGSNQLLDNPDLYEDVRARSLAALEPLPAEAEDKARPAVENDLAVAYFQGLAAQDRRDEAKTLLKSGKFDKVLTPDAKARLMGSLERKTVADAMAEDDVRARAESDIAATTVGGPGGRTTPGEVEARLGPDAAADYVRQQKAAARIYGEVGPLHELSVTGIQQRLEEKRPDPKSPTFAEDTKVYGVLQQAAKAEIARRQADPASWAMAAGDGGPTSVSDIVRGKYEAWVNAPADQKTAKFQEYVRATLSRQTQAGIAPAQQRVFPVGVAGALAADTKSSDPATRKAGLERLERILAQAGPQAGRVNREFIAAGIAPRDLEAAASAAESGNPGFLASYANSTLNPKASSRLDDAGREKELNKQVLSQTRAYLDSLAPLDPGLRRQGAVLDAVTIEARSLMLDRGLSAKEAVETAMKRYDRYTYQGHLRLPKAREDDKPFIGAGAKKVLKGVTAEDGRWLQEPPDPRTNKPMPGAAYAEMVRKNGLWVTLPDDSGAVLMLLTPAGPKAVLDDKGRRITRNWDQLNKRGREGGGVKGRGLPMG